MRSSALLLLMLLRLCAIPEGDSTHPVAISNCLERPAILGRVSVDRNKNPYYLRGDFNGDRLPDYAVAVKGVNPDGMAF